MASGLYANYGAVFCPNVVMQDEEVCPTRPTGTSDGNECKKQRLEASPCLLYNGITEQRK
jgi:hypothetical protein